MLQPATIRHPDAAIWCRRLTGRNAAAGTLLLLAALMGGCGGSSGGEGSADSVAGEATGRARAQAVVPPAGGAGGLPVVGGTYAFRLAGTAGDFMQYPVDAAPAPVTRAVLAGGATLPPSVQFEALPGGSFHLGQPLPAGCLRLRTVTPYETKDRWMDASASGVAMYFAVSGRVVRDWGRPYCPEAAAGGRGVRLRAAGSTPQEVLAFNGDALVHAVPDGTAAFDARSTWEPIVVKAPGTRLPPMVTWNGPPSGTRAAADQPTVLDIDATDDDGVVTTVEVFNGWQRMSRMTQRPYWPSRLLDEGDYLWHVRATDHSGLTSTIGPFAYTVQAGPLPPGVVAPVATVSVLEGRTTAVAGQALTLRALVTTGDASWTQRAELLADGRVVAVVRREELSQGLLRLAWAGAPGTVTFTARTYARGGSSTVSAPLQLTFTAPAAGANQPPRVAFTQPAAGGRAPQGPVQTIEIDASDPDGRIARVDVYDGWRRIASLSQPPYRLPWAGSAGVHGLSARVTDDRGAAGSAAVTFTVDPGVPPPVDEPSTDVPHRVRFTAPADGAFVVAGQTVTLAADVTPAPGRAVDRVEFYVAVDGDGPLEPSALRFVGSDATAPYAVTWTPTRGAWRLFARAVDSKTRGSSVQPGASFDSLAADVYSVTLSSVPLLRATQPTPPAVAFALPAPGTAVEVGQGLFVKARAVGPDGTAGTVQEVALVVDGALVESQPAAYENGFFWWPRATGTAQLAVRATVNGTPVNSAVLPVAVIAPGAALPTGFANRAPRVAVTSPAPGVVLVAGSRVSFAATAQDADGAVTQVSLYAPSGVTRLTVPPYATTWTASGSTARFVAAAQDDRGAIALSAPVDTTVTTALPPTPTAPPATAAGCAGEGYDCVLPAGAVAAVYFGAGTDWRMLVGRSGTVACSAATFGAPAPVDGTQPRECRFERAATAATGLRAEFWPDHEAMSGPAAVQRREPPWLRVPGGLTPAVGLPTSGWGVRYSGTLTAPRTGVYEWRVRASPGDGTRLWVDGVKVLDAWSQPRTEQILRLGMEAGRAVPVRLEFFDAQAESALALDWRAPGSSEFQPIPDAAFSPSTPARVPGTVRTELWPTADTAGAPLVVRTEAPGLWLAAALNPGPGIPADGFVLRQRAVLTAATAGRHVLRTFTSAGDRVRLSLDGQVLIDGWQPTTQPMLREAAVTLAAGQAVSLLLEYADLGGEAQLGLGWKPPGATAFTALPATAILPPAR